MGKKIIFIPEDEVLNCISRRIIFLENLIKHHKSWKKPVPEGKIRGSKSNGNFQFYLKASGNLKKCPNGKYLPKTSIPLARDIVFQEYNDKIIRELNRQLNVLKKTCDNYHPAALKNLWDNFPAAKKYLLGDVFPQNEHFVSQWLSQEFEHNPYNLEKLIFTCSNGLKVRSKSEAMIVESLLQNKIPFKYEYPHLLKSKKGEIIKIFSDFTILRPKFGDELIWEHFGLMDNPEYSELAVKKINLYEENGWILGKNFIATFETSTNLLQPDKILRIMAEII